MTDEDFKALLALHDWSYSWSDDYNVWAKGEATQRRIYAVLREKPELQQVYDKFVKEQEYD